MVDRSVVLAKAVLNTAKKLGLCEDQLAKVLGVDYSTIQQLTTLDPSSEPGERALILIQIFRSLYAYSGGNAEWIQRFMKSQNRMIGGIPIEQVQNEAGLIKVLEYFRYFE
ncbi:antitoxin Xre-like helix-turn-helix domain-containing protein [Acinetobacter pseudolwoffii]|uniref:antitoxin Xre-like helix-turn-helix domain-containing protein n=1 Tax=Acinetobacter pseudolwoffii TaxID=2053287 RepID=UPI00094355B2|nr:antitoxin Xre-like helix-turn-helix domain-containing protein [Acinetobacter pseudolwoffii]